MHFLCCQARRVWGSPPWWTRCSTPSLRVSPPSTTSRESRSSPTPMNCRRVTCASNSLSLTPWALETRSTKKTGKAVWKGVISTNWFLLYRSFFLFLFFSLIGFALVSNGRNPHLIVSTTVLTYIDSKGPFWCSGFIRSLSCKRTLRMWKQVSFSSSFIVSAFNKQKCRYFFLAQQWGFFVGVKKRL